VRRNSDAGESDEKDIWNRKKRARGLCLNWYADLRLRYCVSLENTARNQQGTECVLRESDIRNWYRQSQVSSRVIDGRPLLISLSLVVRNPVTTITGVFHVQQADERYGQMNVQHGYFENQISVFTFQRI
jgi:hypothetical protein